VTTRAIDVPALVEARLALRKLADEVRRHERTMTPQEAHDYACRLVRRVPGLRVVVAGRWERAS